MIFRKRLPIPRSLESMTVLLLKTSKWRGAGELVGIGKVSGCGVVAP